MSRGPKVAVPPPKPVLLFDGDCGFCRKYVRRWHAETGDQVEYVAAQDPTVAARFPEISAEACAASAQWVDSDGQVYAGAEAVFRCLALAPGRLSPIWLYARSRLFAGMAEASYRVVANHRGLASRVVRWFSGKNLDPPSFELARWLFLRLLGVIFAVAFVSLGSQVTGLLGHDGILPVDRLIPALRRAYDEGGIGIDRFRLLPTLSWLDPSDRLLRVECAMGVVLAIAVIVGFVQRWALLALWALYLSLVVVGREFLAFQWDGLLLEAGLLAVFLAPAGWWPRRSIQRAPPLALWLLRLLLFKLVLSSGCVKLSSGDSSWRALTALAYHYQTQPLPTPLAWYANLLPLWWHKLSCAGMFAIELGAPWLILAPRRLRHVGCALMSALQALILLTGNYTFFNWLTLGLCLLLLDDVYLRRWLPRAWAGTPGDGSPAMPSRWHHRTTALVALIVVPVSLAQTLASTGAHPRWLAPVAAIADWLEPLRTFNGYGLFAVMTTERREIVVEGSGDGTSWTPYEFKHKPGDVRRRPTIVAPHQPRLDWQMWFAALGSYRENRWFVAFCARLLHGSPSVLHLLESDPFAGKPPRFVRAELYRYDFTETAERRSSGAWWMRTRIGSYLPPISLDDLR